MRVAFACTYSPTIRYATASRFAAIAAVPRFDTGSASCDVSPAYRRRVNASCVFPGSVPGCHIDGVPSSPAFAVLAARRTDRETFRYPAPCARTSWPASSAPDRRRPRTSDTVGARVVRSVNASYRRATAPVTTAADTSEPTIGEEETAVLPSLAAWSGIARVAVSAARSSGFTNPCGVGPADPRTGASRAWGFGPSGPPVRMERSVKSPARPAARTFGPEAGEATVPYPDP